MVKVPITLVLFCMTGLSLSKNVDQSPSAEVRRSNESVQFKCQHSIANYYVVLWYQQKKNTGLNLIGYISYRNPDIEELYKERFSISGNGESEAFLDITRLRAEDTAVYFCAASEYTQPAYFGQGTKLTVLEHNLKRPEVKVLPPSPQQICNKATVTLVCVVTDFYPDHVEVNWKFNGVDVGTVGVSTDDRALQAPDGKTYSITSRFLTTKKRWFNTKNTFTCVTKFYNGTQDEFFQGSINGDKAPGGVSAETVKQDALWAKLSYGILIAKSFFYGLFVFAVVWKLRRSSGKRQM